MTEETPFVHTLHFNCSIIVMLVMLLTSGATIGTVAVIHALGTEAGEELSRYDAPEPKRVTAPKPEPIRDPMEGIPVAYRSPRIGP